MPEIIENFFENNVFTYQSQPCSCVADTIHVSPNEPAITEYKVMNQSDENIRFAYAAKKGLVRLNDNGTINENNVLGNFIAIPNQKKPDYAAFFSDNGFLFPISNSEYEKISPNDLSIICERLRNTVELMSGVSSIHKNYNKLFTLIFLLLFSPEAEIKTSRMSSSYKTCKHELASLYNTPSSVVENEFVRILRTNKDTITVYDAVLGKDCEFDQQTYFDVVGGYSNTYDPSLIYLYVNYSGDINIKKAIDLLYHVYYDYGKIIDISYENGIVFESGKTEFSEDVKKCIIDTAKYVIGEEINANLSGIYPQYNINTMAPSWKVDSLLSALYFSIFYIKPDMELYRQCSNPRCGKYFLVKTTSTRTKYCSNDCCNRVTQDTYRRNQREKNGI